MRATESTTMGLLYLWVPPKLLAFFIGRGFLVRGATQNWRPFCTSPMEVRFTSSGKSISWESAVKKHRHEDAVHVSFGGTQAEFQKNKSMSQGVHFLGALFNRPNLERCTGGENEGPNLLLMLCILHA